MEVNGMDLNGTDWNGFEWNRIELLCAEAPFHPSHVLPCKLPPNVRASFIHVHHTEAISLFERQQLLLMRRKQPPIRKIQSNLPFCQTLDVHPAPKSPVARSLSMYSPSGSSFDSTFLSLDPFGDV
jgi:hypothetical protein